MMTKDEAQKLTAKILKFSGLPECSVSMSESEQAFVRFANNGVTTAGYTVERTVTVASTRDGKTGVSQTTELDDAALKAVVRRSEELAEIAPVNPERVPLLGPQKYADYENWDEQTASARSAEMIPHVKSIIDNALAKKLVAAGFVTRDASINAFGNSKGNFGYQRSTDSRLTTTVRTPDGSSSGWAGQPAVRIAELNGADLGARAIEKCTRWVKPVKLEPGRYTVVLEPTAVSDLVPLMMFSFSARMSEEGRSFLSKKGGGVQLREKLFPEFISIRTNPFDRRFPTSLWGQGGLPNRAMPWVEKGVVTNLSYDRYWAEKTEKEPTPFPSSSLILEGGGSSLADLIKATDRGLLVTRFWYIRSVNPQTVQVTGLTRDGLFLIEKGIVTQPVVNFRFNESPVRLLQNTKMLGQPGRVRGAEGSGMVAPAIQAADFNFTSISDAV
jgi:predicted Zn-dependent protease